MTTEDALAAIKDVEKTRDKGMKEDNCKGRKGSTQIVKPETKVKGKTKKLLEW